MLCLPTSTIYSYSKIKSFIINGIIPFPDLLRTLFTSTTSLSLLFYAFLIIETILFDKIQTHEGTLGDGMTGGVLGEWGGEESMEGGKEIERERGRGRENERMGGREI